ncbi:MAG: efflux RND transporter periplasmic adaptor subunit [Deltaproteobacteria bacterium]|nr:efflux RND transporter periplasmic adaptor subunit [Deltaproteobacteria bacterium]MBW2136025.1 efflux RND transporter periplasmic adaptor subunit [Deltaproteobacteria bacterium]
MNESKEKNRFLRFIWGTIPWLVVALIVVFVVDLGGRIGKEKARIEAEKKAAIKKAPPPVKVITLTLSPRELRDQITLPAEVEPYENLWVEAELPGQIIEVLVKEGQMVRKGQVLARLDDRDYRSRLARIEANYKLAKLDYERNLRLAEKKITSESRLDESEARLKDLVAQRREAKLALNRTRIRAPIGGRLNELPAKKGVLLKVGDRVAQILQFEKVKVTVGVPESDVAACFDLREADVVIEALGNHRAKGKKIFLSRTPRTLARLYDLELLVDNPDGRILPGMFAQVKLVKEVFKDSLTIPLYAVITQGEDRFVYVERDGTVEKRAVELGVLVGWEVQVRSGLKPGERVVVVGHRFLEDGQSVHVIKNVKGSSEILGS